MPRKYTKNDVINALKEIEEGSMISESAKKYGVPRSTYPRKEAVAIPLKRKWDPLLF